MVRRKRRRTNIRVNAENSSYCYFHDTATAAAPCHKAFGEWHLRQERQSMIRAANFLLLDYRYRAAASEKGAFGVDFAATTMCTAVKVILVNAYNAAVKSFPSCLNCVLRLLCSG